MLTPDARRPTPDAETKADTPALSDSGLHSAAPTPPPTTPEPQELADDELVSGRLTIQVSVARGLSLPQGASLPDAVQKMVDSPSLKDSFKHCVLYRQKQNFVVTPRRS